MLKGILFDMDGTIMDSERHYIAGSYGVMKNLGYEGDVEPLYAIIGTTMDISYDIMHHLLDNKCSREMLMNANDKFFEGNKLDVNEFVFDNIVERMHEFKNMGLKMAICSSSSIEEIEKFVTTLKIEPLFDCLVSGRQFRESKPNPEIYLHALNKLGLNANEAIVYEDSSAGIAAGKAANIFTVAREEKRFRLDQRAADLIVKDIDEFKQVVVARMEE